MPGPRTRCRTAPKVTRQVPAVARWSSMKAEKPPSVSVLMDCIDPERSSRNRIQVRWGSVMSVSFGVPQRVLVHGWLARRGLHRIRDVGSGGAGGLPRSRLYWARRTPSAVTRPAGLTYPPSVCVRASRPPPAFSDRPALTPRTEALPPGTGLRSPSPHRGWRSTAPARPEDGQRAAAALAVSARSSSARIAS